ncbi:Putative KilA-N domain-containing protein L4, partial [Frankliniella fusca]
MLIVQQETLAGLTSQGMRSTCDDKGPPKLCRFDESDESDSSEDNCTGNTDEEDERVLDFHPTEVPQKYHLQVKKLEFVTAYLQKQPQFIPVPRRRGGKRPMPVRAVNKRAIQKMHNELDGDNEWPWNDCEDVGERLLNMALHIQTSLVVEDSENFSAANLHSEHSIEDPGWFFSAVPNWEEVTDRMGLPLTGERSKQVCRMQPYEGPNQSGSDDDHTERPGTSKASTSRRSRASSTSSEGSGRSRSSSHSRSRSRSRSTSRSRARSRSRSSSRSRSRSRSPAAMFVGNNDIDADLEDMAVQARPTPELMQRTLDKARSMNFEPGQDLQLHFRGQCWLCLDPVDGSRKRGGPASVLPNCHKSNEKDRQRHKLGRLL